MDLDQNGSKTREQYPAQSYFVLCERKLKSVYLGQFESVPYLLYLHSSG